MLLYVPRPWDPVMTDHGFASAKAQARFSLLQPHLEQDIPLARIAAESRVAEGSLHRRLAACHLA